MYTRHAHNRRNRNRLLRGRAPSRGGGGAPLTLRQQTGIVLGVQPQLYADARELGLEDGDPVLAFGDFDTNIGSNMLLDDDGWASELPMVTLPGNNNGWSTDKDVENYDAGTALVWVYTCVTHTSATNRSFGGLSFEDDNTINNIYFGRTSNEACVFRTRETTGNQDSDTGLEIPANTPMHIGVAYDGETVTAGMLTGDGYDELLSAAHGIEAALTFDEVRLGRVTTFTPAVLAYGVASYTRCAPAAATPANLIAVLNLHNQHYPVP